MRRIILATLLIAASAAPAALRAGKAGRAIHEARFDPSFTPIEAIIPAIHDSVAAAGIGTLEAESVVDCTRVFMNHWFVTDLFSKVAYAAGFTLRPSGGSDGEGVNVWELHFRQEGDALAALSRMDTWGLRHVLFFPPANWFWCLFRGRILFTSSIRDKPFEGAHGRVVGILLHEMHRRRVEGNIHTPPADRQGGQGFQR